MQVSSSGSAGNRAAVRTGPSGRESTREARCSGGRADRRSPGGCRRLRGAAIAPSITEAGSHHSSCVLSHIAHQWPQERRREMGAGASHVVLLLVAQPSLGVPLPMQSGQNAGLGAPQQAMVGRAVTQERWLHATACQLHSLLPPHGCFWVNTQTPRLNPGSTNATAGSCQEDPLRRQSQERERAFLYFFLIKVFTKTDKQAK